MTDLNTIEERLARLEKRKRGWSQRKRQNSCCRGCFVNIATPHFYPSRRIGPNKVILPSVKSVKVSYTRIVVTVHTEL